MKAIICGAGIAGLSLAWWLEHHGWEVVAVEHAPGPRDEGYMLDFFGSGYDAAELMGMLPGLRAVAYDVTGILHVDARGRMTSRISYGTFRDLQQGRVLSLLRGDLERTLSTALGGRIDLRFGRSIDAVTSARDHVAVTLTDGTTERADLLVGADGIHSRVRELAFGPEHAFRRDLGYHTAAYVFTDRALWSRLDRTFSMHTAPGRQAGCYRLRDGRVAAFHAHVAAEPDLPDDPRAALRRTYRDMGWVTPTMLAQCPEPPALYYDRVAQIEMPRWTSGRVALIGDACHAVSLLAGQGASMAMGASYVLADELARTDDVSSALPRYEARVRPAIERKQAAGRRTAKWFVPSTRRRIALRDLVLRLADVAPLSVLLRPVLTTPGGSIVPRPG